MWVFLCFFSSSGVSTIHELCYFPSKVMQCCRTVCITVKGFGFKFESLDRLFLCMLLDKRRETRYYYSSFFLLDGFGKNPLVISSPFFCRWNIFQSLTWALVRKCSHSPILWAFCFIIVTYLCLRGFRAVTVIIWFSVIWLLHWWKYFKKNELVWKF